MPSPLERRLEPGAHDRHGAVLGRRPSGKGQHVEIVVLTRKTRGLHVGAHAGADTGHLVGGDGHADARSAHEEATLRLARAHRVRHGRGEIRVVHRVGGVRADIQHTMSLGSEPLVEVLLEGEPGVIGSNRDHSHTFGHHTGRGRRSQANNI